MAITRFGKIGAERRKFNSGVQREGPLRTPLFTVMAVPAFDREFSVPALKDYNRYRQIKQ